LADRLAAYEIVTRLRLMPHFERRYPAVRRPLGRRGDLRGDGGGVNGPRTFRENGLPKFPR
jgi:hypothetical protein